MGKKKNKERLRTWQERLARADSAYQGELALMDEREAVYRGDKRLRAQVWRQKVRETVHVRNIASELIEAQVDSAIPQPKVTARRQEDEGLARLIEDMLRGELDRLPMETINDMQERTVPIQGGALYLVEWDNTERTHETVGELTVSALHPKQVIPQDGVYSAIEDMDYIILKLPQTKEYIRRRYGVDIDEERESEPEIKGPSGEDASDDMVTQYVAYYRGDAGGIGLYSWVNDVELEDLEDYQARRLRRCGKCGAVEPASGVEPLGVPTPDGTYPGGQYADGISPRDTGQARKQDAGACPYCGARTWEDSQEDYEEVYTPIRRTDGTKIPGASMRLVDTGEVDESGAPVQAVAYEPTRIPYYKPDIFPVILQRNVSSFGRFLGESDIDKIRDQQNTINRLETKIIEKLVTSGSYLSLPAQADIQADDRDMKLIRPQSPADMAMLGVYTLEGDIEQDLVYLEQVYQEARQVIGVTDSFQGRRDTTATSGKAKEFAAAQSAGRLESKRRMKDAAYAALFEAMFRFKLAYTDEPRPVLSHDIHGNAAYKEFNRYDFLKQDAAGEWYWNDQFLFSCDTTAPLASNREAMWQETRLNLQTGAFGDPSNPETLILFWTKMEQLHYPGAGETRQYLEEQLARQHQAAAVQQQMMMQQQAMTQPAAQPDGMPGGVPGGAPGGVPGLDQQMAEQVIRQAQSDAARDAGMI